MRPYVSHYCVFRGNYNGLDMIAIPPGCPRIIFNRAECLRINGKKGKSESATLCGQIITPSHIQGESNLHTLVVYLKPFSLKFLCDINANAVVGQHISVDDINSPGLSLLERQVLDSESDNVAITFIERFFLSTLAQNAGNPHIKPLIASTEKIFNTPTAHVDEIAEIANMSMQNLRRVYNTHVGILPKQLLRIARLHKAERMLVQNSEKDLYKIIYNCGFTDHQHLNKEFRQLTGLPPVEYVAYLEKLDNNLLLSHFLNTVSASNSPNI